jgi:hypothetical protein
MPFWGSFGGRVGSSYAFNNNGIEYQHRVKTIASYSSSSVTDVICYYSRWWWGQGCFLIRLYRYYYGGDSDHALYLVQGNTRSGNAGLTSVYNHGCNAPFSTDYNSTRERTTIKLTADAYRRYQVEIESYSCNHYTDLNDVGPNGGDTNSFHMPNSQEIFT